METWGWLVVYAVGLALFQLVVYRYLWDRDGSLASSVSFGGENSDAETTQPPRSADPRFRRFDLPQQSNVDGCLCPYCGEENGTGYTYCWNCVRPLG